MSESLICPANLHDIYRSYLARNLNVLSLLPGDNLDDASLFGELILVDSVAANQGCKVVKCARTNNTESKKR